MHRPLLLLLAFLLTVSVSAQKTRLVGRVLDSESGDPLMRATVQLMKSDTTSLVSGAVTNNLGSYSIKNVQEGDYVVKISYIGYHNFFRKVTVAAKQQELNVGSTMLVPSSVMLSQAVVTAAVKQIEVKDDTLIFNADAFKTPEGSVLEDLIKKLPGAQVSSDGTITIGGKTISKILVGGKEFFGSDKSISMKNLPAEIVDKVKTYDKQSDRSKMTGIDDGEEETVLDLTIKKGFMQGWFGNVNAGAGTENRYATRAMLSRFQDKTQASIIGNLGNTEGRGERRDGTLGATMALERGNWEIGGNLRTRDQKTNSWTRSSSQNYVTTRTSYSNSFSDNHSRNRSLSSDFRIEWKPDTMTTFLFRPNISYSHNRSDAANSSVTFNADPYDQLYSLSSTAVQNPLEELDDIVDSIKVNYNQSGSLARSNALNLSGNLIINRRLNTVGRNISANFNGSYSDNTNRNYSLSDVRYFQFGDSTDLTYRYRTTPNNSTNITAGFSYTEPLIAKKLFLSLDYSYNYSRRHSDGKAYDMGDIEYLADSIRNTGAGFLPAGFEQYLSSDLSRYTDDWNYTHNIQLQLRLIAGILNLNVGVQVQPQHQKVKYQYLGLDTIASRNFTRVSPTLNMRFRFTRRHTLRVTYRARTTQPSITDMFNMTDNSDPLNIRLGNPGLKPSFTHNFNADWNDYVTTRLQNFRARLSFSAVNNSISNRTEYNEETGGRITQPQNINGNWTLGANFGFNTPVIVENFYFDTNSSFDHRNQVGYIFQNQETLKNKVKTTTLGERISLTFRKDTWDVGANGNISCTRLRSELVPSNDRDSYDFSYGAFANLNLENGFGASTDISMSSRRGYSSPSMNTNELLWNAQVSYRFLTGRAATISLAAYDILNKRSNISRTISATMRNDSESNAVYSYFMARFIYRFNLFGSASARNELRQRRVERW